MKLFYREKGRPSLPPLILVHGLWGASENWLPIAEKLSDRFHIFLPDLRNHGRSFHAPAFDYESLSADLIEFIQELNLSALPGIIGHSLGGKTVMALLLREPEMVGKAVIIDIAPISYPPAKEHLGLLDFMLKTALSGFQRRDDIIRYIRQTVPNEDDRQILLKNIQKTGNGYRWKINASSIGMNLQKICGWPENLPHRTYKKEILFIQGENSAYIPGEACLTVHFPAAILRTVPQAGHRLHCDQPDLLVRILREYFSPDNLTARHIST